MSPTAVHQFIPSLAIRDAIGTHTLAVQDLLRQMGFDSEIFAGDFHPDLADRARPVDSFTSRPRRVKLRGRSQTWLLYQSSIGSVIADMLMERAEPIVVNYHNITPARLLEGWEPAVCQGVDQGRHQLAKMSKVTRAAVAVSRYNEEELIQAGYKQTAVAPLLLDLDAFVSGIDPECMERLGQARSLGGSDWLFVGRLSPHKAQHDIIKALAAYRSLYDPRARLHLVGGVISESYRRGLVGFVAELGLESAVNFVGSVNDEELGAYYASADVLVCASEHEGFCVPLLEAMSHRLPVVAYAAAAVPETVGDAGLVLRDKSPLAMAAAVNRVIDDTALSQRLVRAGLDRLQIFSPERTRPTMARAIQEALAS